ncbi:unnamed protein product [Caenorhabditis brenneri]
MIIVSLLILRMMMLPITYGCLQTIPGTTPSPTDCCPEVPLILTNSNFPDGTATFAYNSNTCRTTATATCSSTDASLDLYAAIVGNEVNYLEYAQNTATSQFTCIGGSWTYTAQGSTLVLTSVETTDPSTGLQAGFAANGTDVFLDYAVNTITVQLLCRSDGLWTFTRDGRTEPLITVECRVTNPPVTDPTIELVAGIVGNAIEWLDFADSTISVPLACANGAWTYTAQGSTLVLSTLECVLTTTPGAAVG